MTPIVPMGHFTAIGMRTKVPNNGDLVINTCSDNDTAEAGDLHQWSWANPTNRQFTAVYGNSNWQIVAASTECLWQGTKMFPGMEVPDEEVIFGNWRKNKGKKPIGAFAGRGALITNPGEARRRIYIPAYRSQIERWLTDDDVATWVQEARNWKGNVYLRDHDTGRGVDRNGPMSHAWLLAMWLNTGEWPD